MTTNAFAPTPDQDLSGLVGHRFMYRYETGVVYEFYIKDAQTADYRIHTGPLAGRWVKDQAIDLVQLDDDIYKVSWTEPTGTSVALNVMPGKRRIHGTVFFPHWVELDFAKTVLYQNDHLDQMRAYRDAGPTYPILFMAEFAYITYFDCPGIGDETVISVAPSELPAGYIDQTN
ncbi:phenolic acid decarboxylase [Mycolicibacterium sp. CBM1]